MGWRNRPQFINSCPDESEYIMFVDENGFGELKYIQNCIRKNEEPDPCNIFFTLTGCMIHKDELHTIKRNITSIKNKYWEGGSFLYKDGLRRVCFHSRDIRNRKGPFNLDTTTYNSFIQDLSGFMNLINTEIISVNINKFDLCNRYANPYDPYSLATEYLIERYTKFLIKSNSYGCIVIEKRGSKEDRELLNHLKYVIDNGTGNYSTTYIKSEQFKKHIKGVYFNTKWSKHHNNLKSYFGLEITDLLSYPIHSYVRSGCTKVDKSTEITIKKLSNYPNHLGYGLKIFP